LATAFVLTGSVLSSRAGIVVFDDFGSGIPSNIGGKGIIGSDAGGVNFPYQAVAMAFTPAVSGNLEQLTLASFWISGTDSITVEVVADSGGWPEGPVLESFSGPFAGPYPGGLQSFSSVTKPPLLAGSTYWVAVLPGASDSEGAWWNSVAFGFYAVDYAATGWGPDGGNIPALRVEVVPEVQTSASVAALGLLGFGIWRRVRQ
jgi:hypothetical protein